MGSLLKLALTALAASSQTSALKVFTGRMLAAGIIAAVAIALTAAAWGCLCAALWIGLTPSLGPVGAPLAVAGLCIVVAGILALIAWSLIRRRRARVNPALQVDALLAEGSRLIGEHKGAALLAAALLGMLAGNSGRKK
jgi:fatty acid desaturase